MVLRFPTQPVTEGKALVYFPIVLIKKCGVEEDRAGCVLMNLSHLVVARLVLQILIQILEVIFAVRTAGGIVRVAIGPQTGAEVQGVVAFGGREIVLQLEDILVVAHDTAVVTAGQKRALHADGRRVVLSNVLIAKATILETNVVDDFLAQHQAVTYLKRVLHALGIDGLGGQSQLADSTVGSDGAEELVTKGKSIGLPELQIESRAKIDARAGVGIRFIQECAVWVGRGDTGWVNGV